VRVGERDDLAGIAGVGEHLLIAAEDGVEHHFSAGEARLGFGTDQLAFEEAAVSEHEGSFTNGHGVANLSELSS
jgi:hypothetical protein